jgi:serine/threonine-protein kinase
VNRSSYPIGQITAQKIKALALALGAKKGDAAARAFRAELKLTENDLVDETRLYPLPLLIRAIDLYEKEAGEGALDAAADMLVSQECIGAWARLLRGTHGPEEALSNQDGSESEYGRTTRWETKEAGPGTWTGIMRSAHDPALERDGTLRRYRAAELAVVPTLFGYERAEVESSLVDAGQSFTVRWRSPNERRVAATFGVPAAIVAGAAAFSHSGAAAIAAAAGVGMTGALVGLMRERASTRRIAERAQAMRVRALERSLELRESKDEQGPGEGAIVAAQYRLGARMGSGASGVIFEATRIGDDMPVAIKLLRAAAAHDVTASDRLRREAEALGLAWHPNVVEVYDHGNLGDGTSYLVMELLRGDSLATRIRDAGRLEVEKVLPIAIEIADALSAVHAAGVVHRDIKPSNVFLVKDAETDTEKVKILDFGIARVEWEEMRITGTGVPLGTPGYMSPEQESGAVVDARSDLYSFGALVYECLFGEPPPTDEARRFRSGDEDRDSGVHRSDAAVPPAFRALLERALAKSADERFPDARAMLVALKAIAGDAPSETTSGSA